MADRLKAIWTGFEETTSRNLTGKGVDNIIVPHRSDFTNDDSQFLPETYEGPAKRAFDTLRADLAVKEKRFGKKKETPDYTEAAYAPTREFSDDPFSGMYATMMRVERSELDYEQFLGSDAGKAALKKHKKKRFGFF